MESNIIDVKILDNYKGNPVRVIVDKVDKEEAEECYEIYKHETVNRQLPLCFDIIPLVGQ